MRFEVFASVTNLFDKRRASFGALGRNFFNGPNHTFDGANPVNQQFVGPGRRVGRPALCVGLNVARLRRCRLTT
ncbi:hypothetical protein [Burkholderia sp. MS455]|uniref:hypothetical protein n=1 Tax=Burkholderia sp. MS455 TaxID=2811788 RepID=UPI001958970E|nr:hypothetical protein [Burkholderia sp. MS455]